MLANLCNWLDHRTGYKKLKDVLLLEHIPGGAKWRYVWGSCLAFVFSVQLLTGVLLMTAYSPGNSTAWGSVYFIQYEMEFGWLIRGLHHFGSQAMVVLLGLHMLQVVIAGAHLPPREINWWLGLALMGCILGLSLTGYLLPWDQKGFWATQVATNIAGNLPGIGDFAKRVLVGGQDYGNHTLTRFYALHVGILPPAIVVLLILHIAVFRRHGVTAPKDSQGEAMFWPEQAFKDLLACLAVFGVMLALVVFGGQGHPQQPATGEAAVERSFYEQIAYGGKDGRGADLDAPADPQVQYPARPEWYFLFLFQLLKYFDGDQILIGTVIIPNGVAVLLFLLPLFGIGVMRPFGHILGVVVVTAVLTAAGALTCLALADDTPDPIARHLISQLGLLVLPAIGGILLVHLAFLSILPRGKFRKCVFGLGASVITLLFCGTGFLLYGAINCEVNAEWDLPILKDVAALQPAKGRLESVLKSVKTAVAEHVDDKGSVTSEPTKHAAQHRRELKDAGENAHRAVQIAKQGIPEGGATLILRRDPMTAGKALFKPNCGSCHFHKDVAAEGDKFTASDLTNFGSQEWIRLMLQDAGQDRFFGHTKLEGMKNWSSKHQEYRRTLQDEIVKLTDSGDEKAKQELAEVQETLDRYDNWVDRVAGWLATHPTGKPKAKPQTDEEKKFAEGYAAFFDKSKFGKGAGAAFDALKPKQCASCHTYAGDGGSEGPDLTGYGAADWVRLMIVAPAHEPLRYGKVKNAMTAFRNDQGPGAEILLAELAAVAGDKYVPLADVDRELIIRFMLNDDRLVFFGRPVGGPEEKKKQ